MGLGVVLMIDSFKAEGLFCQAATPLAMMKCVGVLWYDRQGALIGRH
jgi:hypothetical protein